MEKSYNKLLEVLLKFKNSINKNDFENIKRITNYFNWLELKTQIVQDEPDFKLTTEQLDLIKRGNVLWANFGFNIGSEFGGHHPAVIIRKMGNGVYIIPLDSGKIPDNKKDKGYYVNIPYVYGLSKLPRHCNVYKMVCIDYRRFDFNTTHGSIKGTIMDKISDALKTHVIY